MVKKKQRGKRQQLTAKAKRWAKKKVSLKRKHKEKNVQPQGDTRVYKHKVHFLTFRTCSGHSEAPALKAKITAAGFKRKAVDHDGSCLFSAVADQLYGNPSRGPEIRTQVVEQMRKTPDLQGFIDGTDFDAYCTKMSQRSMWGGHIELVVIADIYNVNIHILSDKDGEDTVVRPKIQGAHEIFLCLTSDNHYHSLIQRID
eukprot:TRINITY_DN5431_c0_g1_i1.p1 TRINITY_DN5431_c0_g1~~TRINITY_DN5431_c0_g1_i1.p1  ORF type:complete len:200 (-),score=29.62 TRINITY_DN5431_c0_g1_i1:35-634(-)